MKVHTGDNVLVIAGKYRGKSGKVMRVSEKHRKAVVEKINMRVKHIKRKADQAGQKITFEAPFDISNVMVICPHCSKATRVGHIVLKTGKKQRVCKKCSQSLDKAVEKKHTKKV
ncbi:MAG: 50S ribosomal protein L24 [Patescibacteria group bacterium]